MPANPQGSAQPGPSYRVIASVKVEGTGEPAAGAKLDINLGAVPTPFARADPARMA